MPLRNQKFFEDMIVPTEKRLHDKFCYQSRKNNAAHFPCFPSILDTSNYHNKL